MKRLFLDDERVPIDCATYMYTRGVDCRIYHEEWIAVKNYKQFVAWITENGLPDVISFDHDLADVRYNPATAQTIVVHHEKTGMDCAKWLVDYCLDNKLELPNFMVHSANPAGTDNINGLLKNFKEKGSYTSTYWSEEPDENS